MVLFGIDEREAKAFAAKYAKLLNITPRLKDIDKNIESAGLSDGISKKSSTQSTRSDKSMVTRSAIRTADTGS